MRPPNRISAIIVVHTIPQNPFIPHTVVRVLQSCLQKPSSADVGSWDDVGGWCEGWVAKGEEELRGQPTLRMEAEWPWVTLC